MKTMTMRERMEAFVRGRPHDRVPFAQYEGLLPPKDVWALLGRENIGLIRWVRPYRSETPHCRVETETTQRHEIPGERRTLHTPRGSLTCEVQFDPVYGTAWKEVHYVKTLADYDVLDAYLADTVITYDLADAEKARRELGDDGIAMAACPRTAWQQLWVEWTGMEALAWHFAEGEDRVMRTAGLIEGIHRRVFDCMAKAEPLYVDFPDNITAPMIGPDKFRRFCIPLYRELAGRLAESDVPVFCHMDGDLKALWGLVGESGLTGIDSFSPAPDNDTSVADAVRVWPRMRLAMNFPSSVHLQSAEGVRRHTREILAQGGHTGRLMIQLSENVPPTAWRTSLPVIAEEVQAFGKP